MEDAEDFPENKTKHSNCSTKSSTESVTGSKSPDSDQLCKKWTPHTDFLTTVLASSLASSFGSFLASFLASFSVFQFGYIECTEGMEAVKEPGSDTQRICVIGIPQPYL